ncbi:hypothetical protein [Streptomyces sp. NPDC002580]|uniref:hypothetical protein n=1 Tax=Streptomyces sp. NPDC002580 TaxID=3364653 RepID=UPI003682D3EA
MYVRCPNCGGPLQKFRRLTKDEEAAVRKIKDVNDPAAYHRCATTDCRRFQRQTKWWVGGDFPEPDADPKKAAK